MIIVRDILDNCVWINKQHVIMVSTIIPFERYEVYLTSGKSIIVNYEEFKQIERIMGQC